MTPTDRAAQISAMLDRNPKLDRLKAKAPPRIPEDIPEPSPERKAKIADCVAKIAPRLTGLAKRRGVYGVTAEDSRRIAVELGLTTGHEQNQRALSWLANVPKAAGLLSTGLTRVNAQRNRQAVYIHPDYARDLR